MKATDKQQLGFLIRDVLPVLQAVESGFYDGPELLDSELIWVRMTLGDYRRAVRLRAELEKAEACA